MRKKIEDIIDILNECDGNADRLPNCFKKGILQTEVLYRYMAKEILDYCEEKLQAERDRIIKIVEKCSHNVAIADDSFVRNMAISGMENAIKQIKEG